MQIRLATAKDAGQLWRLVEGLIDSEVAHGGTDQRTMLAVGIAYGIDNGEAVFVAEDGPRLVGFVAWTAVPNGAKGEVIGLGTYVDPEFRGEGLSAKLRQAALEHCRQKGYDRVTGSVLLGNRAGEHSAMASGAEVVGYVLRWRP